MARNQLLSENDMKRALTRMTYEMIERNQGTDNLAIVGIKTRGESLAEWIHRRLWELEAVDVPLGFLDVRGYRDDQSDPQSIQSSKAASDLPFDVSGKHVFLVDDVLMTGRTIRSAMDALVDYGRPSKISLMTLIDRGHRELPIRADIVGKNIPSSHKERVQVLVAAIDGENGVYIEEMPADTKE
ncbi:MAG: bifunctional pyr operon transcriptional regulator/uracil phosphoribosyltransferase PyrR [Aerococcus sp.]|nr:bifunctional pyr operon transcriptional regulator/uracil phosphoribosyltransferase PyrR [Aerococcus sp.]